MPIDVSLARQQTPACSHIKHFNNAGASLIPSSVQRVVSAYQEAEYNLGGYEAYDKYVADHKNVYVQIAKLIGATPEEIALTTCSTQSYGIAVQGLQLKAGDKVLCGYAEYVSNFMALLLQKRQGIEIVLIPNDEHGQIDLQALESAIDSSTKLISLTHIPTSSGLINPAEEVGKIARRHGVLYLLDACQSVGQIDVDIQKIGCDILAGTGRKYLRGPRGTGFLFVKKELLSRMEPTIIDNWGGEWTKLEDFRFRSGRERLELYEKNYASMLGLGEAAAYAADWGMQNIEERITFLGRHLREKLGEVEGVEVKDRGLRLGGIVTFTVDGADHAKMLHQLRAMQTHLSIAFGDNARLDLGARGIKSILRASVHYYNTESEIDTLIEAITKVR